jgi:glutamate synthase (NADPH/NADH)
MLLVDTLAGRIIDDAELKNTVANRHDFRVMASQGADQLA